MIPFKVDSDFLSLEITVLNNDLICFKNIQKLNGQNNISYAYTSIDEFKQWFENVYKENQI